MGGGYTIITHYNPKWGYSGYFGFIIPSAYIGIFFLGYYMDYYVELNIKRAIISVVLFCVMIGVQVILTLNEYKMMPDYYLFYDNCTYLPCVIASGCGFFFLKYLGKSISNSLIIKIVSALGKVTFGIFLLSDLFIALWGNVYVSMRDIMHPMLAVFCWEILIFISGGVVTAILLMIPGIKKLL